MAAAGVTKGAMYYYLRAERCRYHERFRALVEEGRAAGTFGPDVPPDLAVDFFFGAVHQLSAWWRPDGPLDARAVGEYRLFLDGLRRGGGGEGPGVSMNHSPPLW